MEPGSPELLEDLFAPPSAGDLAADLPVDPAAVPVPAPEEDR